jgi:SAM-dependent methyltransferase
MAMRGGSSPTAAFGETAFRDRDCVQCPACGGALRAPLLEGRDRLYGLDGTFSLARCATCGIGVTLPLVEAAQLASFYPASYGAYDSLPSGPLRVISLAVQRLLAWQALHTFPLQRLARARPGRLLDVGCGRGDLGSWFVQRGWSVVGVEPSAGACAVARRRGVDARTGMLTDMKLPPKSFDGVVFRHSLEHVADPVADLQRVRLALCDAGVAVISVPNFGCWQRESFGDRWLHLDLPRHRFHFDSDSLRATLERSGFIHISTRTSSSAVALPASIQYALAGRCLFPSGLELRIAIAACALTTPVSWLVNQLFGEGDVLHAIASA